MSVTVKQLSKPVLKDKLKSTNVLTAAEREAVDRMVELEAMLAPYREAIKEFDAKKKFLASVASDFDRFDKEQPAILTGDKGEVEFSPISHPRAVTNRDGLIQTLKKAVGGYDKLLPLIKINMGDIDQYLSEAEAAPYLGKIDGSRSLESVRKK